jgi:uncharacterized MAPEG superfamily protein
MTLAHWCVLVAALLPISCAWIAKAGRFGFRENRDPRAWLAQQSGWRARANAAQANSFEALPFFIGAVLIAHQVQAPQRWVDTLALAFIALRVVYIALYLADKATLRSLAWTGGVACCVALVLIGA